MNTKDSLPPRASFRVVNSILSKGGFTPMKHLTGWNSELRRNDAVCGFWKHEETGSIVYVCTDCLPLGGATAYLRRVDSDSDYTGYRNHHVSTKAELLEEAVSAARSKDPRL